MTTKFDTALTALQTKVRAQAKALKKNEEEEATKAATKLIESGVFDDDTLATVTKESLVADGFAPGLADWFVSTFGNKTAPSATPTLPTEILLKHEKEEDPNDLPLATLLGKIDFTKRDRYYVAARVKAGGQKCFVFDGSKLLIDPTVSLFERLAKGRKIQPTLTIGSEVYYPRTIDQGPITTEEEWSVNPFLPSEPLSEDDTCDTTGLSMKDVQPVTRSILILAQTRTFEQSAFTVHDIETRLDSFKGDAGVRNAKRYYPKAGSLIAQGTVVPLKRSAKSFRESVASPARRLESSEDDADVHPVLPQVMPPSAGASGRQRVLPGDWSGPLYQALIAAGCAEDRTTLLLNINPHITGGLRNSTSNSSQIMLDLSGLNFVDASGQVPLRTYLSNVLQIRTSLPCLQVVQEAIAYIDNAQSKPIVLVVAMRVGAERLSMVFL